jgi:hypothetical protein
MYPKLRINPRGEVCDLHLFPERRTPELAVIGYGAVFDCEGPGSKCDRKAGKIARKVVPRTVRTGVSCATVPVRPMLQKPRD